MSGTRNSGKDRQVAEQLDCIARIRAIVEPEPGKLTLDELVEQVRERNRLAVEHLECIVTSEGVARGDWFECAVMDSLDAWWAARQLAVMGLWERHVVDGEIRYRRIPGGVS